MKSFVWEKGETLFFIFIPFLIFESFIPNFCDTSYGLYHIAENIYLGDKFITDL